MVSAKKELEEILKTIENSSSPQKLKESYSRTKEIIFEGFNSDDWEGAKGRKYDELPLAVKIFLELNGKLDQFYLALLRGQQFTDEVIDSALLACDESDQGYILLGELFPDTWTEEEITENKKWVDKIRKVIIEEKVREGNQQNHNYPQEEENNDNSLPTYKEDKIKLKLSSESFQRRVDELEKDIDYLRSKNKTVEANKLQKRVEVIKSEEKNNPTKNNPTKNNNSFSPGSFFIGGGVVLAVCGVIFFLIIKVNKKKAQKK